MQTTTKITLFGLATLIASGCVSDQEPVVDYSSASLQACEVLDAVAAREGDDTVYGARKQADEAHGTGTNGMTGNGTQFNGVDWNALSGNSLGLNGVSDNGTHFNGVDWNALSGNSLGLNGASINGTQFNLLSENVLSENVLSENVLSENVLSENVLSENGPSTPVSAVSELASTEDGRMFLHYATRCALGAHQELAVPTADGTYVFYGDMGFASEWTHRALEPQEERWLTACLLGHVNAFGFQVPISLRAEGFVGVVPGEEEAFGVHEGAFFGSLKDGAVHSCHAEDPATARELSPDRERRVCTDADDTCSIESVGACSQVCDSYDETIGWGSCKAGDDTFDEVVNIHLRSASKIKTCSAL